MKVYRSVLITLVLGSLTLAGPEFRGPLPEEQNEIIRYLAAHHQELKREVQHTETGYVAVTTSENPEVIARLRTHFDYMEKRLGSGAMVRRWDPAFKEMVDYFDQLDTKVEKLENGIKVTVTGKTPEAVKVAQNHARIVSGFVNEGQPAVARKHEAAIP
ncbi:hypothetical protein [Pontiella sp.]|uniref:hypothetical protein n=1 Tax=Pontiella sp. TaxID=2837462 RepID=UPI00356678A2